MIRKVSIFLLIMVVSLAGCIQFEIKEVILMPTLFEMNLITPTIPVPSFTSSITPSLTITTNISTESPATASITSSPSITMSATLASSSTPPGPLSALVILNARCRFGPGVAYNTISYVSQGDQFFVEGRDADNSWYLIDNTGNGEFCWVSASAIQSEGETQRIQVMTPPPTPTYTPQPTSTSPPAKKDRSKEATSSAPPGETATPVIPYP